MCHVQGMRQLEIWVRVERYDVQIVFGAGLGHMNNCMTKIYYPPVPHGKLWEEYGSTNLIQKHLK